MAGVKISNLPAIVTPALTDVFPVVQVGVTYKMTITQLGSLVLLLGGGTMTGDLILSSSNPPTNLSAASKGYVDSVATGLNIKPSCIAASTTALTVTYSNGASGVGATLTNAGAMAAFSVDGVSPTVGQRILIKNQASTFQNGIYTVTTVGSGAVNWVLTRATDYDTAAEIKPGDFVLVLNGTANAQTQWVQTATVTTIGTDPITWDQFGADINALQTAIQNQSYVYAVDSGAADAYVATMSPAVTSYVAGLRIALKIANTNTTTSTVNVNGLGVKTIVTKQGGNLQAGDLVAGAIADLEYDGTNFQLVNRNNEKRAQNESFNYILDTGAANAYVATLVPAVSALVAGLRVSLKIANANTAASTLNVNGLGATAIKLENGAALTGAEMVAGMIADLRYDGTNFQLLNPSVGLVSLDKLSQGRLTLTTAVPITTTDVTAATTVYFTPFRGNFIDLYDGTGAWQRIKFAEISIAVPAVATQMYDVFVYNNAGVATLELTAWTNDTTRATALTTQDGVLVKTGATTRRYVGSFRTIASGQTEDSGANRFLWNYYNRVYRSLIQAPEATNSWTYSSATIRQANANTANQLNFIIGVSEDIVEAFVGALAQGDNAITSPSVGIGLDSTTSNSAQIAIQSSTFVANLGADTPFAMWKGYPGVGRHFLAWLESNRGGANTVTWYGDNNDPPTQQSGISGSMMA